MLAAAFLLLLSTAAAAAPPTSGDLAALLSLRSTLGIRAADWPRRGDPCISWSGVTCSSGHVSSLHLSALRRTHRGLLRPSFSVPSIASLTNLSSFNASSFPLPGPIPASSFPPSLTILDLRAASVSGDIPSSLSSLINLAYMDLSSNNLSGTIPSSLTSLPRLKAVNFSRNNLYGSIPFPPDILRRLNSVDVYDNYLNGAVPNFKNGSFRQNCFGSTEDQRRVDDCKEFYLKRGLTYDSPEIPVPAPAVGFSNGRRISVWKYVLAGVFGCLALVIAVILVFVMCWRRGKLGAGEERGGDGNVASSGGRELAPVKSEIKVSVSAVCEAFEYEQLVQATSGFSGLNFIKHGHSGELYRGVLEGGGGVVVKRIDMGKITEETYMVELGFLSEVSHVRLVPFLGQCLGGENEKFLVYKYTPHGDLSSALYRKPMEEEEAGLQSLDWITRLKIAIGVAEALCFLHHECTPPLVHRDIQASSVLLDDKFEVRLGSLSKICTDEGVGNQNVISRFLRLSQKTDQDFLGSASSAICAYDMYCLGKVLLELVTGKLGISGSCGAATSEWLDQTLPYINVFDKELITKIIDPSLVVDEDFLEEVWAMAIVAKSCLNPKPSKRPLARHVLKALENPLKVAREENGFSSAQLRNMSSRGSWHGAILASWRRSSSDIGSVSGLIREDLNRRHSVTERSQGSRDYRSCSCKRASNEIVPEPTCNFHT